MKVILSQESVCIWDYLYNNPMIIADQQRVEGERHAQKRQKSKRRLHFSPSTSSSTYIHTCHQSWGRSHRVSQCDQNAGHCDQCDLVTDQYDLVTVTSVTRDPTRPTDSSKAARSRVHSMQRFKLRAQRENPGNREDAARSSSKMKKTTLNADNEWLEFLDIFVIFCTEPPFSRTRGGIFQFGVLMVRGHNIKDEILPGLCTLLS